MISINFAHSYTPTTFHLFNELSVGVLTFRSTMLCHIRSTLYLTRVIFHSISNSLWLLNRIMVSFMEIWHVILAEFHENIVFSPLFDRLWISSLQESPIRLVRQCQHWELLDQPLNATPYYIIFNSQCYWSREGYFTPFYNRRWSYPSDFSLSVQDLVPLKIVQGRF